MGDSLADWLALREPFDARARSVGLTRAVADRLPRHASLKIIDLGTGRGSNVRYLAGHLPFPQQWLLVDKDPALLAEMPRAMAGALDARCEIDARRIDLETLDPALFSGRHLVTASALLDLVSEGWLHSLAAHCASAGAVALFALTYNGASRCSPVEPEDDTVRALMNRHQRANDKGFGRAAGPDAVDAAERAFEGVGYGIQRAHSDWVLPPEAGRLQRQLVEGWAAAASEMAPKYIPTIRGWLNRRLSHVDAGRSHIIVCHEDLAAWPSQDTATVEQARSRPRSRG